MIVRIQNSDRWGISPRARILGFGGYIVRPEVVYRCVPGVFNDQNRLDQLQTISIHRNISEYVEQTRPDSGDF